MSTSRKSELIRSISTHERLIANYTLARHCLMTRRRGAADHVMVELDQRLEANTRTIAAFERAVHVAREHLKLIEQGRV